MTFKEIRDHKFKILFMYYTNPANIDEVLYNYFDNFPYETTDDENAYTMSNAKTLKSVYLKDGNDAENDANDMSISIDSDDILRDIKFKVKDIVEKTDEIDAMIKAHLKEYDLNRLGKAELVIIRLALYEMYYDSTIDLKVAINEALELAKVYAEEKASKFINAVLAAVYKSK